MLVPECPTTLKMAESGGDGGGSITGGRRSLPPHLEANTYASGVTVAGASDPTIHPHPADHARSMDPGSTQNPRTCALEDRPGQQVPTAQHPHLHSPLDFPTSGTAPRPGSASFATGPHQHSHPQLAHVDHIGALRHTEWIPERAIHAGAETEPALAHSDDAFGGSRAETRRADLEPSPVPHPHPSATPPPGVSPGGTNTTYSDITLGHRPVSGQVSASHHDRDALTGPEYVAIANQQHKMFPFLDAALVDTPRYKVNELRAFFSALAVFSPFLFYFMLYDQSPTVLVIQAEAMDRTIFGYELAPDSMQALNALLLMVFIPANENFLLPFLHKCHIRFPPLWRIWFGFLLISSAFVYAGCLQLRVSSAGPPISYAWQIPFWVLLTVSEVFFAITALEFAYAQTPPRLKSVVTAAFWFTDALGNLLLALLLATTVLEQFSIAVNFFAFAALMVVITILHIPMVYRYQYIDKAHGDNSITWLFDPAGAERGAPVPGTGGEPSTEPDIEPASELGPFQPIDSLHYSSSPTLSS